MDFNKCSKLFQRSERLLGMIWIGIRFILLRISVLFCFFLLTEEAEGSSSWRE